MRKNSLWKILMPKTGNEAHRRTFYYAKEYDKYKEYLDSGILYDFVSLPSFSAHR